RPAFQFLGSYRAGWLGVASAALLPGDAGAIASLGLERATAVASGLEPALFQSLDWRLMRQL
ncbi:MAG: hypothetical protein AB1758_10180, partial [Candidatus Eremiobacterota bacterium]